MLVVAALVVSAVVLALAFDDLDWAEVGRALRSLDDAEIIALSTTWLVWIAAQGLQTSSLVHDLPVRRGVVAYLGPAAVASAVPGPSDFPVRYRMLTSWGYSLGDATLAVAAGGVFNIGIKLVLPIIAAVGLLVSDTPVEGTLRTIVAVALLDRTRHGRCRCRSGIGGANSADRSLPRPDLAGPAAPVAPACR